MLFVWDVHYCQLTSWIETLIAIELMLRYTLWNNWCVTADKLRDTCRKLRTSTEIVLRKLRITVRAHWNYPVFRKLMYVYFCCVCDLLYWSLIALYSGIVVDRIPYCTVTVLWERALLSLCARFHAIVEYSFCCWSQGLSVCMTAWKLCCIIE